MESKCLHEDDLFEHETAHPPLPEHKEHHCTDKACLVFFLLALVGVGCVHVYARQHADIRRLSHGFNYHGHMCGVETRGQFVYWCKGPENDLALKYPICVDACPHNARNTTMCLDTYTMQLTAIPTYPTRRVGKFCLPLKKKLRVAVLKHTLGRTPLAKFVRAMNSVLDSWKVLVLAMAIAIVVGYTYLLLLRHYAKPLVKACMVMLVVGPFCLGVAFFDTALRGGPDRVVGTGDGASDLAFGFCLHILSLAMLVMSCFFKSLSMAVGCIEAACECIFQEYGFALEPFISLSTKIAVSFFMLRWLVLLLSCVEVHPAENNGVWRFFQWSPLVQILVTFHVLMLGWLLEFGYAASQYSLAHATQKWYFTPLRKDMTRAVNPWGICQGYANAFTYHLGTLAIGSLVVGLLRPVRLALGMLAQVVQSCNSCTGETNVQLLACILRFHHEFIEFWNKCAYMDVAITSENFCRAAKRSTSIISNEVPAVAMLRGAQFIFQVAGLGIITLVPAMAVWLICKIAYRITDEETSFTPEHLRWVVLGAALVSLLVASNFMVVYDTVSDTILYCFAIDQRRHRQQKHLRLMAAEARRAAGQKTQETTGLTSWFLGGSSAEPQEEDEVSDDEPAVEYAPVKLRKLLSKQEALYH